MRLFFVTIMMVAPFGCSRNSPTGRAVEEYITVCGVIDREGAGRVANATIELYDSPKETNDLMANRYQLAIADQGGQFKLKAVVPGRQYWLAIVPKAACVSMAEQEARRIPLTAQRRANDAECQDSIKVFLDASCNPKLN